MLSAGVELASMLSSVGVRGLIVLGQTRYFFGSTAEIRECADLICDAATSLGDITTINTATIEPSHLLRTSAKIASKVCQIKNHQPTPSILTSPSSLSHSILIANAPTSTHSQTHINYPPTHQQCQNPSARAPASSAAAATTSRCVTPAVSTGTAAKTARRSTGRQATSTSARRLRSSGLPLLLPPRPSRRPC